jgi:hypothetical protein
MTVLHFDAMQIHPDARSEKISFKELNKHSRNANLTTDQNNLPGNHAFVQSAQLQPISTQPAR